MKKMICIVGAGISGLYLGFRLHQAGVPFHIFEKSSRIGGRAGTYKFHDVDVNIGAGVGRRSDTLLLSLMTYFDIPVHFFSQSPRGTILSEFDIRQIWDELQSATTANPRASFRDFGIEFLGFEMYKKFVQSVGYSDFEKMCPRDVFENYGMEDNIGQQEFFGVPWSKLCNCLAKNFETSISRNEEVLDISNGVLVTSKRRIEYSKVVITGTISCVQKLYPFNLGIVGQPFIRVYAKMTPKISSPTIVSGPLQKIIPIDKDVVMIAYSDNRNARILSRFSKEDFEEELSAVLGFQCQIFDLVKFEWLEGTHTRLSSNCQDRSFSPKYCFDSKTIGDIHRRDTYLVGDIHDTDIHLVGDIRDTHIHDKDIHLVSDIRDTDIYLVGEAFSRNQGWVNSAIESAESIVSDLLC